MKLEILQEQQVGKHNVIWYGGEIFQAKKGTMGISVVAVGNIKAKLFDEHGVIIEQFVDENNTGKFYEIFKEHIKDDNELYELIKNGQEGNFPCLILDEQNWFEVWGEDAENDMLFADTLEDVDYSMVHLLAEKLMDYYIETVKEERQ